MMILQHPGARCAQNNHDPPPRPIAAAPATVTPASTGQANAATGKRHDGSLTCAHSAPAVADANAGAAPARLMAR